MKESAFSFFRRLDKQDNFAHLYKNSTEADDAASRFIIEGILQEQRIYYLSDKEIPRQVLIRLYNNTNGLNKESISRYLKWIKVNPDTGSGIFMYSSFMKQAEKSIYDEIKRSGGNSLSRLIINKLPSLHENTGTLDIRTAARINKLCKRISVILMYQFKLDKLSSEDLLNVMKSNPKVVENDYVHESPFYLDPRNIDVTQDFSIRISEHLTVQEEKILRGIINGLSNKAIADNLSLSPRTVESHRANIMRKLDVNNLVDLVKLAIKNGFI